MERANYQAELEELIQDLQREGRIPTLLLHSCCGPCSSHVLSCLKDAFDVTVLYYNPNIYPEEEYRHRLSEQRRLIEQMNLDRNVGEREIKLIEGRYDYDVFRNFVRGLENEKEGGARCRKCFELRLSETGRIAAEQGFDYFGTTLTVSPHKNALVLNSVGSGIAGDIPPVWLSSDFKKRDGYKHSIELSKKYDLYRQNYCGCEFSIWF